MPGGIAIKGIVPPSPSLFTFFLRRRLAGWMKEKIVFRESQKAGGEPNIFYSRLYAFLNSGERVSRGHVAKASTEGRISMPLTEDSINELLTDVHTSESWAHAITEKALQAALEEIKKNGPQDSVEIDAKITVTSTGVSNCPILCITLPGIGRICRRACRTPE